MAQRDDVVGALARPAARDPLATGVPSKNTVSTLKAAASGVRPSQWAGYLWQPSRCRLDRRPAAADATQGSETAAVS